MKKKKKKKKKQQQPTSLREYALNRLLKGGFVFPTEPEIDKTYLRLPPEITNISDQDLGEYLNAFVQQKNWVLTLLANLEVEIMEVEEAYEAAYSSAYDKAGGYYESVNDKKEYANSRKEVKYWKGLLNKSNAALIMAQRNLETLENAIFLISREVSRRMGLRDNEIRLYNVENIRRNDHD